MAAREFPTEADLHKASVPAAKKRQIAQMDQELMQIPLPHARYFRQGILWVKVGSLTRCQALVAIVRILLQKYDPRIKGALQVIL